MIEVQILKTVLSTGKYDVTVRGSSLTIRNFTADSFEFSTTPGYVLFKGIDDLSLASVSLRYDLCRLFE
jgi:hypothetical protein